MNRKLPLHLSAKKEKKKDAIIIEKLKRVKKKIYRDYYYLTFPRKL